MPSLNDGVARDSRPIHVVPACDELEVAKLPFQLKTNKTWQWGWKPGKTSYRSSDRIFKTKWTLYTKWHTLASQSANTEVARATLVVQRATKVIDVVSMYHEKLKEASKEVSRKFGGKEFQENVSFVAFLKPWMHWKNSVAIIETAQDTTPNRDSTFSCYYLWIKFL